MNSSQVGKKLNDFKTRFAQLFGSRPQVGDPPSVESFVVPFGFGCCVDVSS